MDFVIEAEERISLISVLCILRGASKMPLLAHLGPLVGHLPKDPLHDSGFLLGSRGKNFPLFSARDTMMAPDSKI